MDPKETTNDQPVAEAETAGPSETPAPTATVRVTVAGGHGLTREEIYALYPEGPLRSAMLATLSASGSLAPSTALKTPCPCGC